MKVENANQRLLEENSRLHNRSIESFHSLKKQFDVVKDTIRITGDTLNIIQQYTYTTARVINNTTNRKYNFMTLNKGKLHGIKENMGVVSSDGIVGIVKDVSDHFSTAVSLLNVRLGISAKLKKNNYPGLIQWAGFNPHEVSFMEIPAQMPLELGDTIITSGYSTIFPEGIIVGTINNFELNEENNTYKINVNLGADYLTLNHVYVIGNLLREEQLQLEKAMFE